MTTLSPSLPPVSASLLPLLAALSDGAVVTDRVGRVQWFNAGFAQITGHALDAAAGLPLLDLLGNGDGDEAPQRRLVDSFARGVPCSELDLWHLHRDGHLLHSRLTMLPAADGEPICTVVLRAVGEAANDAAPHAGSGLVLSPSPDDAASQLRMALDIGNIGVWRHDLLSDLMYFSQRAFDILGLPMREEGMTLAEIRELIHPDDLPRVVESAHRAMTSGRPVAIEARYRHVSGQWRDLHVSRTAQRDATGRVIGFVGVSLDVTEQVATTRREIELTRSLDLATSAAGVGVWSRSVDDSRIDWNPQEYLIHGLDPASPAPSGQEYMRRIVHPEDQHQVMREWQRLTKDDPGARDNEYRIVRPSGEVRWVQVRYRVDASGGEPTIHGITLDTTDRRASVTALREANERAAFAVRGAGIGTWEMTPDREASLWDEQMYRLRGLDPADGPLSDAQRRALLHPEDLPRVLRIRDDAAARRVPASYEFRVRWPDGSYRWLASRSMYVSDERGGARQLGVNWDISDAKSADAARQERILALRESRAKSEFLARMSHELRTPLNAVLGFTQLLQADDDGSSPSRSARLGHIRAGGEHLLTLINEVLDLSSLESGEMKLDLRPVDVADVLSEALPLVMQQARAKGVTVEIGGVDGIAMVDRTRLRQVLINLLTNAIKYNRPKGRVRVHAGIEADRVVLHVSDTGRGMTREQLDHLFEPFNRLGIEREGVEGTGIGLVIVKMLVERMGGEIEVRSDKGVGSVFELRLLTPDTSASAPLFEDSLGLNAPVELRPLRKGTVLYIEDNPVNTLLVQELILHREDLSLVCEADGESGAARAAELMPDLVLLDMQLPDMDGYEVLRRLRADEATANIPVIALSANAMTADIERALAAGFSDYWTKPIDISGFMSSLDSLFARSSSFSSRF